MKREVQMSKAHIVFSSFCAGHETSKISVTAPKTATVRSFKDNYARVERTYT